MQCTMLVYKQHDHKQVKLEAIDLIKNTGDIFFSTDIYTPNYDNEMQDQFHSNFITSSENMLLVQRKQTYI